MLHGLCIRAGCVHLHVLQLQKLIKWGCRNLLRIGFHRREQSLHVTQLQRNNVDKIVTQAAKEDYFSSCSRRIKYHFAATETVICVHTTDFVRCHLILQGPISLYCLVSQPSLNIKSNLSTPKAVTQIWLQSTQTPLLLPVVLDRFSLQDVNWWSK